MSDTPENAATTPVRCLRDFSLEELKALVVSLGEKPFRATQIQDWLVGRLAASYDEMKNLPRAFRERLAQMVPAFSLKTVARLQDPEDGTVKWLSELSDGHTVETVLMRIPERSTVCISTQVGCPVQCVFCASGRGGLVRNLSVAEIMDQVILASRENGGRVDNIVVMGMGEPLLNLDALIPALRALAFGVRRVTISTSGIVPGILRLAKEGDPWNLALSLHAVDDEMRGRIIPAHHRYPLSEIFAAMKVYREKLGDFRHLTLEYALVAGQNDSPGALEKLARIAADLQAKVNFIPCNPNDSRLTAPTQRRCQEAVAFLESRGVTATLRRSRGQGILAACGQLRQKRQQQQSLS
jgi:23S rRNA (adenine2503-C2)-methyltransferase